MLNKRIRKPLQHCPAKLPIVLRISDGRNNLLKNALLQKTRHSFILQTLPYCLQSIQMSSQNHRGMGPIQDPHFALFVWVNIVCPDNMEACLLQRKLIFMLTLYHPQMENLRRIHHIILLTDPLAQHLMLIPRETSHDPVYESRAKIILILQPCLKVISQVPQIRILQTAFLQLLPIMINQLTGKNNKSL